MCFQMLFQNANTVFPVFFPLQNSFVPMLMRGKEILSNGFGRFAIFFLNYFWDLSISFIRLRKSFWDRWHVELRQKENFFWENGKIFLQRAVKDRRDNMVWNWYIWSIAKQPPSFLCNIKKELALKTPRKFVLMDRKSCEVTNGFFGSSISFVKSFGQGLHL